MSDDSAALAEPPSQCSWSRYLDLLVEAHGGWVHLVDVLYHRARGQIDLPDDPQTVERGLRRLATRGHAPGGKYGRWMLRFFGVPRPLEDVAQWMGCYHTRFADLPLSIRESQLQLWDRPPICESSAAVWIHLGLASIAMRKRAYETAESRLGKARVQPEHSSTPAILEATLLSARLKSERKDRAGALVDLEYAHRLTPDVASDWDRDCYVARLADQRAYLALRPEAGSRDLVKAHDLYDGIPLESISAFARFRRSHGLAYCCWKMGRLDDAIQHAEEAADQAADGGYLRFRAMSLNLLASIRGVSETHPLRIRARTMALKIEHEDLLGR